jgi:hypothetical protein
MEANAPRLVSKLIDPMMAIWDQQKLETFFVPVDREVINNIALSTKRQHDFWAWHNKRRGVFSVRSAYRMLVNTRGHATVWLEGRAGKSDRETEEKEWATLWHVLVPAKVRVFLWRLAWSSIPTGDVLAHRNMASQNTCAICGEQDSWRHALLDCNMSKCVWALEQEEIVEHLSMIQEPSAKG